MDAKAQVCLRLRGVVVGTWYVSRERGVVTPHLPGGGEDGPAVEHEGTEPLSARSTCKSYGRHGMSVTLGQSWKSMVLQGRMMSTAACGQGLQWRRTV